jgi:CRISPR-associated endonuclease/helicase Cas3
MHAQDTAEEMESLLASLSPLTSSYAPDALMVDAARWHDLGKVHPAFQDLLTQGLPTDDPRRSSGPWAKSDRRGGRNGRRHFRHELASALSWLDERRDDLGAFLIAAHHGKVRLTIRARPGEEGPTPGVRFAHGIHEGDTLDGVDLGGGTEVAPRRLSLACMELGGGGEGRSWSSRMADVLRRLGPFRLAFLESLVRVADWRASARRSPAVGLEVADG